MKKILLSLAIIFIALSTQAQTEKGTWLLGGSASFSSTKATNSSAVRNSTVSPVAGYFINNNLALGAGINLQSITGGYSSFSVAPFVRYYFLPIGTNAKLFGNGSFGYGSYKYGGSSSNSMTTWELSAGPAFFLSKNVAVEFALAYGSTDVPYYDTSKTISLKIGFQIHFNNGKKK
ncbi:MAG: outer membrane beta-barrel protein [Bacteroidota bacterium]|nr:outer membrane beta-barrel protein [Bacteroidota bacterium]